MSEEELQPVRIRRASIAGGIFSIQALGKIALSAIGIVATLHPVEARAGWHIGLRSMPFREHHRTVADRSCTAANDAEALARSTQPIVLERARTDIPLAPLSPLASSLERAGERKFFLVLQGLRAQAPSSAVYSVYLNLPPGVGSTQPQLTSRHLAGSFVFFDREIAALSFDVTQTVLSLRADSLLKDGVTVVLLVSVIPDPGTKTEATAIPSDAKAEVGQIALVERCP